MDDVQLDSHAAAVEEFKRKLLQKMQAQLDQMVPLLMECEDQHFFGQTEFQLRELLLELGREATQQALEARKKSPPKKRHP